MSYQVTAVTLPAGEYVVGDPCYSVPDERWMEWLEAADYLNQYRVLVAKIDGYTVVGIRTAHGDGMYSDENDREYAVDAGLIGMVPIALAEDPDDDLKHRVTFGGPVECGYQNGVIVLGDIRIDTDPEYEDGYDEYEEEEEEEEE